MRLSRRQAIGERHCGAGVGVDAQRKGGHGLRHRSELGAALDRFYHRGPWSRSFAQRAAGILVFPTVVKAGFGFGGEYGEGSLLIHGRPAEYYTDSKDELTERSN